MRKPWYLVMLALVGLCAVATGVVTVAYAEPPSGIPSATGEVNVTDTIYVDGTFDGEMKSYSGLSAGGEGQKPMFVLSKGATLKNVILGSQPGDGVHCKDTCLIQHVFWKDAGDDAATLDFGAPDSAVMTVEDAIVQDPDDKAFQHNGGGTMVIKDVKVIRAGHVYASCGSCSGSPSRHVKLINVDAGWVRYHLVAIQQGDTAELNNVNIIGGDDVPKCQVYDGNGPAGVEGGC